MEEINKTKLASRAGEKLLFALQTFGVNVKGKTCADLGSSTGGFVDVLLKSGAKKVYSVDTARGMLKYKLVEDERVVVMERTNALHVKLPEEMDFISVDVNWTPQKLIIPQVEKLLKSGGEAVSLIKSHYESKPEWLEKNKTRVKPEFLPTVLSKVKFELRNCGLIIKQIIQSPILGGKGKNVEYLMWLKKE